MTGTLKSYRLIFVTIALICNYVFCLDSPKINPFKIIPNTILCVFYFACYFERIKILVFMSLHLLQIEFYFAVREKFNHVVGLQIFKALLNMLFSKYLKINTMYRILYTRKNTNIDLFFFNFVHFNSKYTFLRNFQKHTVVIRLSAEK